VTEISRREGRGEWAPTHKKERKFISLGPSKKVRKTGMDEVAISANK